MTTFDLTDKQSWTRFLDKLMALRDSGVRLTVTVNKYSKRRSTSANAFYWACVVTPLSEHTGYTVDEVHDELLMIYTGTETRTFNGHTREFPRRRTTSPEKMETMDFAGLIEVGQRVAAALGVKLPDQES